MRDVLQDRNAGEKRKRYLESFSSGEEERETETWRKPPFRGRRNQARQ